MLSRTTTAAETASEKKVDSVQEKLLRGVLAQIDFNTASEMKTSDINE